jgi:hypothetical protein
LRRGICKITYAINARDLKKIWKNQLCACTWIEIMTSVGISLYLAAAMYNYILADMSPALFAALIGYYFVITLISKRDELITIQGILRTDEKTKKREGYARELRSLAGFQLMILVLKGSYSIHRYSSFTSFPYFRSNLRTLGSMMKLQYGAS